MTRTLSQALADDGVTLTCAHDVVGGFRAFHGTVHLEDRTMDLNWTQDVDNPDTEPSVVSVLAPVIRNAQTAEAADTYEDWAGDFSLDPEQWMPRQVYTAQLGIAKNLRSLLGDERYEGYNSDLVEHDD